MDSHQRQTYDREGANIERGDGEGAVLWHCQNEYMRKCKCYLLSSVTTKFDALTAMHKSLITLKRML